MVASSLRPIQLRVENISGMTANISFDSNLVIVYGYNREGKTILIRCFDYAFNGFRPGNRINLRHALADTVSGSITLVFAFKGILYKLIREITRKQEHVTLQRSLVAFSEYQQFPKAKKKLAFEGKNGTAVIPRTEIKSKGSSTQILSDELKKINIHPEVIERLIVIENIQEFKNATQKFGTEGGGYDAIKDILYKDLKEKSDAIESITKYASTTLGKLEMQSLKIHKNHAAFLQELEGVCKLRNETLAYENLINQLTLDKDFDNKVQKIRFTLKDDQRKYQGYKRLVDKTRDALPSKKAKYEELDEYLSVISLEDVERVVDSYYADNKVLQTAYQQISQVHRELKASPSRSSLEPITVDFSAYLTEEIRNTVEAYGLNYIDELEELTSIPNRVNEYVDLFNEAIRLYRKREKVLTKYKIDEDSLVNAIINRQSQLTRICNPIKFAKKDRVFELFGKVGVDSTGNNALLLHMPLSQLKEYVDANYPLRIEPYLFPVLTKDDDPKAAKKLVNALSKQIEESVSELRDLQETLKCISALEPILLRHIKDLEVDLETVANAKKTVDSWNKLISEQKTMARKFIEEHSSASVVEDNFKGIAERLEEIRLRFKEELKTEGTATKFTMDSAKPLLAVLEDYDNHLGRVISETDELLRTVEEFLDFLANRQNDYKSRCKNLELTETLKKTVLPAIQTICKQIDSNIQLDEIEEQVMVKIIKYAELFYKEITKERYLKLEKTVDGYGKIFLKPKILKSDGTAFEIADDMPSGSEQGAVALGIMVALAKLFNGLIVIDEVTDRFDYGSKQRFFEAINKYGEDLFWIIVLKTDSSKENMEEEFQEIRDIFPDALLLQPVRRNLKIQVNRLSAFEDFTVKEG